MVNLSLQFYTISTERNTSWNACFINISSVFRWSFEKHVHVMHTIIMNNVCLCVDCVGILVFHFSFLFFCLHRAIPFSSSSFRKQFSCLTCNTCNYYFMLFTLAPSSLSFIYYKLYSSCHAIFYIVFVFIISVFTTTFFFCLFPSVFFMLFFLLCMEIDYVDGKKHCSQ